MNPCNGAKLIILPGCGEAMVGRHRFSRRSCHKAKTQRGHENEVAQQVLEGEDVGRHQRAYNDLLFAAAFADLPVALGTLGMDVVAVDAGSAHELRGDQADGAAQP